MFVKRMLLFNCERQSCELQWRDLGHVVFSVCLVRTVFQCVFLTDAVFCVFGRDSVVSVFDRGGF